MGKIQVLDTITIDKIAAGEVIERPASVVKELVENAIDAGATSITVEIEEGGISYMRIADNGSGIDKEDIRNAFLRHSTSKIRQVEDLMHIHSLGFRGEALSSICAVSQVELITKTKTATFGMRYCIHGGKEISLEETGAKDGTTFIIRQLFYNTPARRKFLKSPMTEASHIGDLMTRLALSHPQVSFQFINNGQSKLHTSGNGNLKDVIYHVYGREIASNLLKVTFEKNDFLISGYLGKPIISRGNRNFENYFINGRYIRNNIISKAIEDGYKDYSMQHKYPFCVLQMEINGEDVDVNVHPAKMEMRFHHQQDVYNNVYQVVCETLKEPELIPQVELDVDKAMHSTVNASHNAIPTPKTNASHNLNSIYDTAITRSMNHTEIHDEKKSYSVKAPYDKTSISNSQTVHGQNIPRQNEDGSSEEETKLNYFMAKMKERVYAHHAEDKRSECESQSTSSDVSNEVSYDVSNEVSPDVSNEVSHDVSNEASREVSNEIPNKASNDVSSKISNDIPKETLNNTSKDVSEEHSAEPTQLNLFDERLISKKSVKEYKIIGQVFDTYWLVEFKDNLYIIDQHAAHERVLYEKTLRGMKDREYTSQMISPPIILNLSMQEAELLNTYMDQFTRIGFEIEEFGEDSYAVRAVPDNLFSIAKKDLLLQMLDGLSTDVSRNATPDLIDEKIASMSCKAAVKGNMRLSIREVDTLIGELLELENPYHCPHGRPTIIAMSKRELEKKFKRIV